MLWRRWEVSDFIKKFDRENAFPHNDPEIIKHIKFIKWMKSHGGHIRKTKIVVYGKDYRGLHAIKDINIRETVISIPITLAISGLNLEKKELGEKLLTNIQSSYSKSFFFRVRMAGSCSWNFA